MKGNIPPHNCGAIHVVICNNRVVITGIKIRDKWKKTCPEQGNKTSMISMIIRICRRNENPLISKEFNCVSLNIVFSCVWPPPC